MNKFYSICRLNIIMWSIFFVTSIFFNYKIYIGGRSEENIEILAEVGIPLIVILALTAYITLIVFWKRMRDISKSADKNMYTAATIGLISSIVHITLIIAPVAYVLESIASIMLIKYFKGAQKTSIIVLFAVCIFMAFLTILGIIYSIYLIVHDVSEMNEYAVYIQFFSSSIYYITYISFFASLLRLKSNGKQQ